MRTPEALRAALQLRARLYGLIREFFAARGVLEVETPILSAGANTEPNIASFVTRFSGHVDSGARERWLRTSFSKQLSSRDLTRLNKPTRFSTTAESRTH